MVDIPKDIPRGAQYYAPAENNFQEGFYKKEGDEWQFIGTKYLHLDWSPRATAVKNRTLIPINELLSHEYLDNGIWMPVRINYKSDNFIVLEYITGDDAGLEICLPANGAEGVLRTKVEGDLYRELLKALPAKYGSAPLKEVKPILAELAKVLVKYGDEG